MDNDTLNYLIERTTIIQLNQITKVEALKHRLHNEEIYLRYIEQTMKNLYSIIEKD